MTKEFVKEKLIVASNDLLAINVALKLIDLSKIPGNSAIVVDLGIMEENLNLLRNNFDLIINKLEKL